MLKILISVYRYLFARKIFSKFNKLVFLLSAHSLGIFNSDNLDVSGENHFLKTYFYLLDKQNPLVIDVGANQGKFSSLIKKIQPNSTLIAFEPHPKTYKNLVKIANKYEFQTVNLGLSDKKGRLKFYDYKNNDGSTHASLYKNVIEKLHNEQSVSHTVKVTTLDEYMSDNKLSSKDINLLKIDTEGHEYAVLEGAKRLIKKKKIDAIQFEFNDMNIESKIFLTDFIRLLPDYQFYRLLPEDLLPLNTKFPLFTEIFAFQNIVAVRKDIPKLINFYGTSE